MRKIIDHFGSFTQMSKEMGVSISAVSQWGVRGIPPWRAVQIEKLTEGKFKAGDITYLKLDGTYEDR